MPVDKYGCHPGVSGVEGGGCTAHDRDPRPLLAGRSGGRDSEVCSVHLARTLERRERVCEFSTSTGSKYV